MYAVEMASGSFLTIGTDVQAILRFDLGSSKGCNAGFADRRY
jgi:hypothetical protein